MSTDPAAVAGSVGPGPLFFGNMNMNDLDFTGYNNSNSSTMSIETLDLADVLKNPHVKSLHEKWTHATEQVRLFLTRKCRYGKHDCLQVMSMSENQTSLVQENARLRIEIAVLKAETHQPVAMGSQ